MCRFKRKGSTKGKLPTIFRLLNISVLDSRFVRV